MGGSNVSVTFFSGALGHRMEKVLKVHVDAMWARLAKESAKREKLERERVQQVTIVADTQKSIWLIDEVRESNVRIINITFDDEIVSNFYFSSLVSFQCTRFCI